MVEEYLRGPKADSSKSRYIQKFIDKAEVTIGLEK
jgi:hypothetical protein